MWFNLVVGTIFIGLSLSLFGLFDLRMPSWLIDRASKRSGSGGVGGAFFMAVTLALTSFSCSLPFLAALFQDFEQGDHLTAIVLLLIYSCTMAAPFVACSLFPALLKSMPRAGGWMNAIKVTMGFVEFALAFKFFRGAAIAQGWEFLPRSLVYALWIACALSAALYLFGYITLPHDTKVESIGVVRALFAVGFLTFALYMLPGPLGRPVNPVLDAFILTPPSELWTPEQSGGGGGGSNDDGGGAGAGAVNGGSQATNAHGEWPKNDWDGALARSAATGRPVLFDFTGVG
jgi:thiol:disulfide interchange protein DsbD